MLSYFVWMLNSRGIKLGNICENKVLANNSEFTVHVISNVAKSTKKTTRLNTYCLLKWRPTGVTEILCVNYLIKFLFSDIHQSMNAMDHVQSNSRPKEVTSMNIRKMKFISYINSLFKLHRQFTANLVKYAAKKFINWHVWTLRWTAVSMRWCQYWTLRLISSFRYPWRCSNVIVVHHRMSLACPQRFI